MAVATSTVIAAAAVAASAYATVSAQRSAKKARWKFNVINGTRHVYNTFFFEKSLFREKRFGPLCNHTAKFTIFFVED